MNLAEGVDLYEKNPLDDSSMSFVILKAWEYREDHEFATRWPMFGGTGKMRGAYCFGHPGLSAKIQAGAFAGVVKAHGFDHTKDNIWLDIEVTDGKSPAEVDSWCTSFCHAVDDILQTETGIYSYISYIKAGNCNSQGHRRLWISAPSYPKGQLKSLFPLGSWKGWTIHQYGVVGIDRDVYNGDEAAMREFWSPEAPHAPGSSDQKGNEGMADTISRTLNAGSGLELPVWAGRSASMPAAFKYATLQLVASSDGGLATVTTHGAQEQQETASLKAHVPWVSSAKFDDPQTTVEIANTGKVAISLVLTRW